MRFFKDFLALPQTKGMDIDDPQTTVIRRSILLSSGKRFLYKIYQEWYTCIAERTGQFERILELGSGAGFIKNVLPQTITSEIFEIPGVDMVVDAHQLPFESESLQAIVMTDVFHHIPNATQFLREASRCVVSGGKIVMIEPWNTPWAKFIYQKLHHEPFNTEGDWDFPLTGPLSGSNQALPWIIFERDKAKFNNIFPEWEIKDIKPMMPVAYLLSGGISLKSLCPSVLYPWVRAFERLFGEPRWSMFTMIELVKK